MMKKQETGLTDVEMDQDDSSSEGQQELPPPPPLEIRNVSRKQLLETCRNCPNDCQYALTVFAKHRIKRGYEEQFEAWVKEITQLQQHHFKGYLSSELIRPMTCCSNDNEYVSIFRFDSYQHLQEWMDSSERQKLLQRTTEFSDSPLLVAYHSLEYWFVPDNKQEGTTTNTRRKPPSKHKMWLVTCFVIFAQLQWVIDVVGKILPQDVNPVAAEALSTVIIVTLVTYVIMPIVTRFLAFWLFPEESYRDNLKELVPSFLKQKQTKAATMPSSANGPTTEEPSSLPPV